MILICPTCVEEHLERAPPHRNLRTNEPFSPENAGLAIVDRRPRLHELVVTRPDHTASQGHCDGQRIGSDG